MFKLFKKKEQTRTVINDLHREEREEAIKWLKIAQNVANYDGTAKGQVKI